MNPAKVDFGCNPLVDGGRMFCVLADGLFGRKFMIIKLHCDCPIYQVKAYELEEPQPIDPNRTYPPAPS